VFLRTDPALALTGRRCVPRRLLEAGFEFAYPTLPPALDRVFD
jgi:NAD dependent epimerase/dehydratase family enzyme